MLGCMDTTENKVIQLLAQRQVYRSWSWQKHRTGQTRMSLRRCQVQRNVDGRLREIES